MTERCATSEEMSAYLDGELSAREVMRLRLHLELCASCGAQMEGLQLLSRSLQGLPDPAMPTDMVPLLRGRISTQSCTRRPAGLGWHPWHLVPLSLAAALMLSIGVLLGNALVAAQQEKMPTQHPMAFFDLVPPGGICIGVYDCYRKGALQ